MMRDIVGGMAVGLGTLALGLAFGWCLVNL